MLKTIQLFGRSFIVANSFLLLTAMSSLAQTLPPPPSPNNTSEEDKEVYQFEAPTNNSPSPTSPVENNAPPSSQNRLFRVQVYGSSEQLLSLVRRVEPNAFVPEGKQIIQVGLFSQAGNARELVQALSQQGIEAEIIQIQQPQTQSSQSNASREWISLSSSPEINNASQNLESVPLAVESSADHTKKESHADKTTRGYYVVIPSSDEQVAEMAQAVEEAGVRQRLIQKRDAPRGTHVAVGPFSNRNQASRWSSQLQTEGLDARVYFGR